MDYPQNNLEMFEKLAPNSRIWIYQSNKKLTENECIEIQHSLHQFTTAWHAHQQALSAAAEIKHQQFIILAVDENMVAASGCSIDSSVRFLKGLENQYQIELFDRMRIAYWENNEVHTCTKNEFQEKIDTGLIHHHTLVFNNMIQFKSELENHWLVPITESWHQKVFQLA